jgi:ribosomal protein S18 acetylase RimI-like enzyme
MAGMDNPAHTVEIRRADINDASALARVGATAFTQAFGHLYPAEDLEQFLRTSHNAQTWGSTLSDAHTCVLIAEGATTGVMGYIAVGPCKLPVQDVEPFAGEVQQLYVLAEFHNLKLGSRLMEAGLSWLTSQNRAPLYVGVWSENYGAQRFYSRYGFRHIGEYGFRVGSTIDREFIFKCSPDQ